MESGQGRGVLGCSDQLREALQPCVEPVCEQLWPRGAGLAGWDGGRERECKDGRGVWLAAGFEWMTPMQRHPRVVSWVNQPHSCSLWGWCGPCGAGKSQNHLDSALLSALLTGMEGDVQG